MLNTLELVLVYIMFKIPMRVITMREIFLVEEYDHDFSFSNTIDTFDSARQQSCTTLLSFIGDLKNKVALYSSAGVRNQKYQ